MGDGYTAAEQHLFRQDAATVVEAFRSIEPIATYFGHFNFHRIDVISRESGTNDRWVDPPARPRTALDTFFSPLNERRLVGPDPWVMMVATLSGAPWDRLLVVVNAPRRGGATLATMTVAYASRNSTDFPRIMIHEAGHVIAGLMDEYDGELPDIDFAQGWSLPNILPWPNVDTNARKPKWWRWLTPNIGLPTPADDPQPEWVGAFEGATYSRFGVYRPQQRCLMRSHSAGFCHVCTEQWIGAIYKRSRIADDFTPAFRLPQPPLLHAAAEPLTFAAEVIRTEGIQTTWRTRRIDHRRWTRRQQTADYAPFTVTLPPGRALGRPTPAYWLVECALEDSSTRIRTPAIRNLTRQRHVWHVISA
jgi:hypothetical protein